MESVLEDQRSLHEERERTVDLMVKEWMQDYGTQKEKINVEHRVKGELDRYVNVTKSLHTKYTVGESKRQAELNVIGGPNEFAEFYSRLKMLKEEHRKSSDDRAQSLSTEFATLVQQCEDSSRLNTDYVRFTDEEGYGRFLDLNNIFLQYMNLKQVKRIDYVTWLLEMDKLYEIKRNTKKTSAYKHYIESMRDYFVGFIKRTRPLYDLEDERKKVREHFEDEWKAKRFIGWTDDEKTGSSLKAPTTASGHLDLSPFASAVELQALGLERLKQALQALGLKCGGTLAERAARLFSTKGKQLSDIDSSLFAGGKRSNAIVAQNGATLEADKEALRIKEVAAAEADAYHFIEMLRDERQATRENVERRQARTAGEMEDDEEAEAEAEAAAAAATEFDDEPSDVPYNPKNVPLGWDGKPIPYWLYKLHGLNISYPCEICGNQVYKGPKAFQMHFTEWRHSHGMRCLGIPNTAHFSNITRIADAVALWKQISANKEKERFRPEMEEEFEDSAGNVVTRKTYEDLQRQGLL